MTPSDTLRQELLDTVLQNVLLEQGEASPGLPLLAEELLTIVTRERQKAVEETLEKLEACLHHTCHHILWRISSLIESKKN